MCHCISLPLRRLLTAWSAQQDTDSSVHRIAKQDIVVIRVQSAESSSTSTIASKQQLLPTSYNISIGRRYGCFLFSLHSKFKSRNSTQDTTSYFDTISMDPISPLMLRENFHCPIAPCTRLLGMQRELFCAFT